MFGLRWSVFYNHCFEKPGFEKLTLEFRKMEEAEASRDLENGQVIYVEGHVDNVVREETKPTEDELSVATKVKYWTENGEPQIRGNPIVDIPKADKSIDHPSIDDFSCNDLSVGCTDFVAHFSQETATIRENDIIFARENNVTLTQEVQHETMESLRGGPEALEQRVITQIRECFNRARGRGEESTKRLAETVETAIMEYERGEAGKPTNVQGNSMVTPFTGKSTQRKEKLRRGVV